MYNLVGFQTNLKFPEQKRVFSMIPGLEHAEFHRYGVMHRNSFLDSPRLLDADYHFRGQDGLYFAGQMTGVEGYMESAASGILAGKNLARRLQGKKPLILPKIRALTKKMDYKAVGGAVMLGVQKPVVKAHGSSDAQAFFNAIRQARDCVAGNVVQMITDTIGMSAEKKDGGK